MQNAQLNVSPAPRKFVKIAHTKLTRARVKKFRESLGLSPAEFGKLFRDSERLVNGYTRTYISKLERGKTPITQRFEKHFYRVREQLRQQPLPTNQRVAQESEIIADFTLPLRLHIIPTPRKCQRPRCPVCIQNRTKWFVPHTPNQRQHVLKSRTRRKTK